MSLKFNLFALLFVYVAFTTSTVSGLPKRTCFQNAQYVEYLYPSENFFVKKSGSSPLMSSGKVMSDIEENIKEPFYGVWQFKKLSDDVEIAYIYHEKRDGYLSAYDRNVDKDNRDVFVDADRKDLWRIYRHPKNNAAVVLRNLATAEYLYAVSGEKGQNLKSIADQTSRSVFLKDFDNLREALNDRSALWFMVDCVALQID